MSKRGLSTARSTPVQVAMGRRRRAARALADRDVEDRTPALRGELMADDKTERRALVDDFLRPSDLRSEAPGGILC
jgi:hypothetical protein